MKNKICRFFILLLFAGISHAQWQPDVRLTNDAGESLTSNNAWCVASSGSFVHAVWSDSRDGGNGEIYYKRSTDGGISWGTDTRLTNDPASSWNQSVIVSGSVVHVVWQDNRDGNTELYYKRTTNAGESWDADTRLTNNSASSVSPSVAVSGSFVHVVWFDDRDGNYEIYYKRSTDGGASWGADTRLTNNSAESRNPSVSASGSDVHVVWEDFRDGNWEIYYKGSIDVGVNWDPDTRMTNNSANSWYPSVSVSGSDVHVVWSDNRDGNLEIYYKGSINRGVNWDPDTRLTNNSASSRLPSVTVSGSAVHVVWQDNRNGTDEIYYKRSLNAGVSWEADTRLTNNFASQNPSVSVSGPVVHVVWKDFRDGNWEIYYKRDPTGNPIGIINVGTDIPKDFSMSQNYPNPFNPVTMINYQLPKAGSITIKLFDALGRESQTLFEGSQQAGSYKVSVDGTNLASGVYYCRINTADYSKVIKMSLIK